VLILESAVGQAAVDLANMIIELIENGRNLVENERVRLAEHGTRIPVALIERQARS
jgi:hypothetical protein